MERTEPNGAPPVVAHVREAMVSLAWESSRFRASESCSETAVTMAAPSPCVGNKPGDGNGGSCWEGLWRAQPDDA